MPIHRFLGGSTQTSSNLPRPARTAGSGKMDPTRVISLAGLSMILVWVCLSIRRTRNLPRHHAAERLFEDFKDEIQGLSLGAVDPYEILGQAFSKHEKAYIHFRPHLKGKVLREFDEAWKEYCRWREENSSPSLELHSAGVNEPLAQERQQLALRKVLRFLSSVRMYSGLPPR